MLPILQEKIKTTSINCVVNFNAVINLGILVFVFLLKSKRPIQPQIIYIINVLHPSNLTKALNNLYILNALKHVELIKLLNKVSTKLRIQSKVAN